METYLISAARQRKNLWTMNPSKLAALENLVNSWEEQGHKIIVFSDDKLAAEAYSHHMGRPCMTGDDDPHTREKLLANFRASGKTIFMTKVGDAALDLPDASVIIQISGNFGSRQQHTQRLGRVLRPKPGNNAEFNAHFYSLVSKDTQEMYFSSKRQRYLVDQGYAFKVVTCLENKQGEDIFSMRGGAGKYGRTEVEKDLLQRSLEDRKEQKERYERCMAEQGAPVRRQAGNMSSLSGGSGVVYAEVKRASRHKIFQDRDKARKGR